MHDKDYSFVLDGNEYAIDDQKVTGRQLLEIAGKFPVDEFLIFQFLKSGQLEELRLDEKVDLSENDTEEFFCFKSSESYRFTVNGRRFEWGAASITARMVLRLAKVDPDAVCLWLEVRGGDPDRLISLEESVALDPAGIERLYTSEKDPVVEYKIKVNGKEFSVTTDQLTGREILELASLTPAENYTLRLKISGERPRKVRLDEEVDLTKPGVEKFKALPRDQTEG